MPSKAQLKQEVDELRANLSDTTRRLSKVESNPKLSEGDNPGKMTRREQALEKIRRLERQLEITKTEHAVIRIENEINRLQSIYGITMEEIKPKLSIRERFPSLPEETIKALEEAEKLRRQTELPNEKEGNPIACAADLSKIESDIAAGKTYWDIKDEQYRRWQEEEDACLPCEKNYIEAKSALTEVGNRYTGLVHPKEDIKVEDIAAQVRERTAIELHKAEAHTKELEISCGIRLTRVRGRITKMKPLAHVGRWDEFMELSKELLLDFELDIKETIPELEVKIPSYAVPRFVITTEYERIKARLTEEERKKLEEREKKLELERGTIPRRWAAYKCPYCPARFETIVRMHEHVAEKHPEKIK